MPTRRRCPPDCGCGRHVRSEELRRKMSLAKTGLKHSEETKAKLSAMKLGVKTGPRSKDFGRKIAEANRGRVLSADSRKKIGDAHRKYPFLVNEDGYRLLTGYQGHVLATLNGSLLEHRKVLFEKIGIGPHLCYWGCGRALVWRIDLHVDHLDGDRVNNISENLVASCLTCNAARAREGNPREWSPCVRDQ